MYSISKCIIENRKRKKTANRRGENTSEFTSWNHYYPNNKTRLRSTKKENYKLIPLEYRYNIL